MAAIIERTAAEDVEDALDALRDLERYTVDLRAHLTAAARQGWRHGTPEPGTLDAARHVAEIVAGEVAEVQRFIRDARR